MFKVSLSVLASLVFAASAYAQTPPAPVHATGMAPMEAGAMRDMPAKPGMPAMAPGAGPGKVWVNTSSKVYHCQDSKYYGKTKHGEYMMEADAKTKGFKGVGGKACKA